MASGENEDEPALAPDTQLGRYRIVRLLGRGGMGAVYEAVHVDLKKRVALKTLNPSVAQNADVRARFVREGEAASRIHHPHIVDVTDVGSHEGTPFLVMEFLEGEDLDALLRRQGQLPTEQLADIMIPVMAAVASAHEAGVVHRDLKPANIYLTTNTHGDVHPKVLDFGISKLVDSEGQRITQSSSMLGTPLYMSPEQAKSGKFVDARSDQYSLGVILYEAATGAAPYPGDSLYQLLHSIVEGQYAKPREVNPALSPEFEALILGAMAKDPNKRFPTVRDLGYALLPHASESTQVVWRKFFGRANVTGQHPAMTAATAAALASQPSLPSNPTPAPTTPSPAANNTLAARPSAKAARDETGKNTLDQSATTRSAGGSVDKPRGNGMLLGIGLVVLLGGGAAAFMLTRGGNTTAQESRATTAPPAARTFRANLSVEPAVASLELDGTNAGTGSLQREFPIDGRPHTLVLTAPGFVRQTLTFRDAPPPERVALEPLPQAPAPVATATTDAGATAAAPTPPSAPATTPTPTTAPSTAEPAQPATANATEPRETGGHSRGNRPPRTPRGTEPPPPNGAFILR